MNYEEELTRYCARIDRRRLPREGRRKTDRKIDRPFLSSGGFLLLATMITATFVLASLLNAL